MKRTVLLVLLLLVAAGGIYYYARQELVESAGPADSITDFTAVYGDIADDLAEAKERLKEGKKATIVVRDLSGKRQAALVIEGLPERTETMRLLDVLSRHKVKALFLIEGDNAILQPETLRAIISAGQDIGNYTFMGMRSFQDLPQEEMLVQILRTQRVLQVMTGRRAALFRAPQLKLTPMLMESVYAAGVESVVWPNVFVERNTLHSEAEAAAKAAEVVDGSIISIPGGEPVEPVATKAQKLDERPAIDKKPTIPAQAEDGAANKRAALADEVDRLLTALEKSDFSFSSVRFFRVIGYVPEEAASPGGEAAAND